MWTEQLRPPGVSSPSTFRNGIEVDLDTQLLRIRRACYATDTLDADGNQYSFCPGCENPEEDPKCEILADSRRLEQALRATAMRQGTRPEDYVATLADEIHPCCGAILQDEQLDLEDDGALQLAIALADGDRGLEPYQTKVNKYLEQIENEIVNLELELEISRLAGEMTGQD